MLLESCKRKLNIYIYRMLPRGTRRANLSHFPIRRSMCHRRRTISRKISSHSKLMRLATLQNDEGSSVLIMPEHMTFMIINLDMISQQKVIRLQPLLVLPTRNWDWWTQASVLGFWLPSKAKSKNSFQDYWPIKLLQNKISRKWSNS
jgi:hypothetical protein